MTPEQHLHHLAIAGDHLSEIAATTAPTTPVTSCGDWTLEQLITHCAQVWSFVAASIRAGEPVGRNSAAMSRPDGVLSDWHAHAVTEVHHLLESMGPDAPCWTFSPDDHTAAFWMRRMAHEAAMHRWDAEHARGTTLPIDAELAVDGIDELFDHFIAHRKPDAFAGDGETVHLHSTDADGEWLVTRTTDGIEVERTHAKGDVAARGTASDLLLFVWGRKLPEYLEVFGEIGLLVEWQEKVRF
jgi:uncharacterized protein (TIGR03083 family)